MAVVSVCGTRRIFPHLVHTSSRSGGRAWLDESHYDPAITRRGPRRSIYPGFGSGVLLVAASPVDNALPAWAVCLIDELNAMDERATTLARGLSPTQLNSRTAEGTWSVASGRVIGCVRLSLRRASYTRE